MSIRQLSCTFLFAPVILVVLTSSLRTEPTSHDQLPARDDWLGRPFPEVKLTDLQGGLVQLTNSGRREVVVLSFWATWCGACQKELAVLQEIARQNENRDVAFWAVNDREDALKVRRFVTEHPFDIKVCLDANGTLAQALALRELPALVVVNQEGLIQHIHTGLSPEFRQQLQSAIDSLVAGHSAPDPASLTAAGRPATPHDPTTRKEVGDPRLNGHPPEDFRLTVASGKTIDLKAVFTAEGRAFQHRFQRRAGNQNMLRLHYENRRPFLTISHRGGRLHGPTVGLFPSGLPMVYIDYAGGKRAGTLFTWDEDGRPWVFIQYKKGKKHGLCCVFRACGEQCQEGHVWLVQEWRNGSLQASYLSNDTEQPQIYNHIGQYRNVDHDALNEPVENLKDFETLLATNERKLRQTVSQYSRMLSRQRQAARQRQLAATLYRNVRRVPNVRIRRSGRC